MRFSVPLMLLLALVLGPEKARPDVYTWVDESGTVHFSEEPPARVKQPKKVILPEDPPQPEPENAARPVPEGAQRAAVDHAPPPRPAAGRKPLPLVELFTTSWCPYCKRARAYFQGKGVPFTEHDIEKEAGAGARLMALTGSQAVPTAVIGDKLVRGYSPSAYEAALGL